MNFEIGDFVKRKDGIIPDNEPGAAGMSVNTAYEIIWIAPNGLCVLKNYLMLVSPEYLEVNPHASYPRSEGLG
ncbi:hypothetical protein [Nostoc sp.]|uniref:hypothetical protein n=1 Tax=Nostoc sp. TaxID=1180 RepID=UPI002FF70CC5